MGRGGAGRGGVFSDTEDLATSVTHGPAWGAVALVCAALGQSSQHSSLSLYFSWETPRGQGPLGLPWTTVLEPLRRSPFFRQTLYSFLSNSARNEYSIYPLRTCKYFLDLNSYLLQGSCPPFLVLHSTNVSFMPLEKEIYQMRSLHK